jgi:hypothetical protein
MCAQHCSALCFPLVAASVQLLTEATRIPICNERLASFRAISSTVCDKCGRPIEGADISDAEAFVCPTCVNDEWAVMPSSE